MTKSLDSKRRHAASRYAVSGRVLDRQDPPSSAARASAELKPAREIATLIS
jgi:hypothetical protein